MIEEKEISIEVVRAMLSNRGFEYQEGVAYIMPESSNGGLDLINEYSPDLMKDFKSSGIDSVVVRGKEYRYKALRSIDVILPLVYGIPFAIFANFITCWIKSNIDDDKKIKIHYIEHEGDNCKEIIIEGKWNEISEVLENLKSK